MEELKKSNRGGSRKGAGRPRSSTIYKGDKRDNQITLRLAKRELELINLISKKLNISRTDVIIMGVEKLNKDLK